MTDKITISARVPPDTHQDFVEYRSELNISKSDAARRLIAQGLRKTGNKQTEMSEDKQRTSMSLPTEVIEMIEEYQDEEHLDNRSEAIERITRKYLSDKPERQDPGILAGTAKELPLYAIFGLLAYLWIFLVPTGATEQFAKACFVVGTVATATGLCARIVQAWEKYQGENRLISRARNIYES